MISLFKTSLSSTKVAKQAEVEVKAALWSIFDDIDEPPGE